VNDDGMDFWMARDIHDILGYPAWDKFEPVIDRAAASLRENGIDPSHHIAQTSKMMELGKGAQRKVTDYFLSRAACRLIAMNGDPAKPQIAGAQAYFVVQTHRMEQIDQRSDDEKRLELREKVSQSVKRVSGVAQDAGVRSAMQGVFHDARYQGLYGMSLKAVKVVKGLQEKQQLLDRAGSLELSMHDFQMNLAASVIAEDSTKGEQRAIKTNLDVARRVRKTVTDSGKKTPESLPLKPPIKEVKKRLTDQKKLRSSNEPSSST
jgi:DNA-damage-inducible protein D